MAGDRLGYRYELGPVLQDSEAVTSQRALDVYTSQQVVLKLLRLPVGVDEAAVRAWSRRLKAQRGEDAPPGVPQVVEAGTEQDGLLLTRQWVDGLALDAWLGTAHNVDVVLGVVSQVLHVLAGWQEGNWRHGWLHPGNIVLTSGGPVFTDWDQTPALHACFDLLLNRPAAQPFLAPEVRAYADPLPESDVYSVGMLLKTALDQAVANGVPQPAGDDVGVQAPPPSAPALPEGYQLVLDSMLAEDPSARYPAAQAAAAVDQLRARARQATAAAALPAAAGETPGNRLARQQEAELPLWVRVALGFYRILFMVGGSLLVALVTLAALGWASYRQLDKSRPPEVVVPDITGFSEQQARALLVDKLGLTIERGKDRPSGEIAANLVLQTQPAPGRTVRAGRKIVISYSTGQVSVAVPSLTGRTLANAKQVLASVGLAAGEVKRQPDADVAKDEVVSQVPIAGTPVSKGDQVALVVSSGKPASEPQDGEPPAAGDAAAEQPAEVKASEKADGDTGHVTYTASGDQPVQVRIVVTNDDGEDVLFDGTQAPGETTRWPVPIKGATKVRVYQDDQVVLTKDF